MRPLAIVLAVLGALALIAAILYFALPSHALPFFLPGKRLHVNGHDNRRGIAGAVAAVVLLVIAYIVAKRDQPAAT